MCLASNVSHQFVKNVMDPLRNPLQMGQHTLAAYGTAAAFCHCVSTSHIHTTKAWSRNSWLICTAHWSWNELHTVDSNNETI